MKTLRIIIATTCMLAALAGGLRAAGGGGGGAVHAIMIVASNEKGRSDPKLAPYEANLKRLLRFESYRAVAEGAVAVPRGGEAVVELTRGHRLELKNEGGAIRATWFDGKRKVIALTLTPGQPAILGGPAWGEKGEVCALIIVPQ